MAGVAVLRISGKGARRVFDIFGIKTPEPRRAAFCTLKDPKTGYDLDEAIGLYFPGPNSFTGEDVVELQVHGSRAVVSRLLDLLGSVEGFRMAEAGEFTRRAFENGRMDLIEAEGLIDLIEAETEAQRVQALRQMQGGLSAIYEGWMDKVAGILANLEASIDFSDEDDVPDEISVQEMQGLLSVIQQMRDHLADSNRGELVRDGVQVAIIGAPNAGKSSLLNALVGRDAAIVSSQAGTTRDLVTVTLVLSGIPVVLTDTAGLRETADVIEEEGVRRAIRSSRDAQIILRVGDLSDGSIAAVPEGARGEIVTVWNKLDRVESEQVVAPEPGLTVKISAATGEGLNDLKERLGGLVSSLLGDREMAPITRARHRQAVEEALEGFESASQGSVSVLVAEDLRHGVRALGRVIGTLDVEDLLDRIFRDFCIGK